MQVVIVVVVGVVAFTDNCVVVQVPGLVISAVSVVACGVVVLVTALVFKSITTNLLQLAILLCLCALCATRLCKYSCAPRMCVAHVQH